MSFHPSPPGWKRFFLVMVMLLGVVLGSGCCRDEGRAQVEKVLRECLISASALPQGWEIAEGPMPYDLPDRTLPGCAMGGVTVVFNYPGVGEYGAKAYQNVFLYQNEQKAAKEFERRGPGIFHQGTLTPWEEPQYPLDLSADAWRAACAQIEGAPVSRSPITICKIWARYGVLLMKFSTWQSAPYMSLDDFARVAQRLDERMRECEVIVQQKIPAP